MSAMSESISLPPLPPLLVLERRARLLIRRSAVGVPLMTLSVDCADGAILNGRIRVTRSRKDGQLEKL